MSDKQRPAHETKDMGISRFKENYTKNTGKTPDSKTMEKFIKTYERDVLPQVYDKK